MELQYDWSGHYVAYMVASCRTLTYESIAVVHMNVVYERLTGVNESWIIRSLKRVILDRKSVV